MISKIILILIFVLSNSAVFSQIDLLRSKIENILSGKRAKVGVAISSLETKDTLSINGNEQFVMQSVFKFHLALAVLSHVENCKLSLKQNVFVPKSDLQTDTWSPLRDKFPDGNVNLALEEILKYTVSHSDNNGCDILFKLIGGTKVVNDFIHSIGINDVSISATEEQMHKDMDAQFTNWSTSKAACMLLNKFTSNYAQNETHKYLWQLMTETSTGPKRLKGLLPEGTVVAHKTGTSDSNDGGMTFAINDIGVVVLPSGKVYSIAVFVSNTYESYETNEAIIANISKATYDYFISKTDK
ncbi:MAG: class A beta-lactamase, subclass A2 [Ignavibacteriae bacterium]|nr:class A beta-lactamase, subclass A2 [Ignavibacteriota bacterium]